MPEWPHGKPDALTPADELMISIWGRSSVTCSLWNRRRLFWLMRRQESQRQTQRFGYITVVVSCCFVSSPLGLVFVITAPPVSTALWPDWSNKKKKTSLMSSYKRVAPSIMKGSSDSHQDLVKEFQTNFLSSTFCFLLIKKNLFLRNYKVKWRNLIISKVQFYQDHLML